MIIRVFLNVIEESYLVIIVVWKIIYIFIFVTRFIYNGIYSFNLFSCIVLYVVYYVEYIAYCMKYVFK